MVERVDRVKQEKNKAAIDARRAYYKTWRNKNKDKVKEYNARYWAKKAAESEAANIEQAAD